jgi:SulP family sulfate permease
LKYDFKGNFCSDLIAAVVIAIMVLPQSIAYAQLAGLPSEYGIYASVYPAISYALFNGQSRQGAIGPMSIVCLLMGAVADTRVSGDSIAERLEIIMTLSLLCGVWMFVLGLLGLESLVGFVSRPVFTGFVSACGVITALSVSKDMFGVYVVIKFDSLLPTTHTRNTTTGTSKNHQSFSKSYRTLCLRYRPQVS